MKRIELRPGRNMRWFGVVLTFITILYIFLPVGISISNLLSWIFIIIFHGSFSIILINRSYTTWYIDEEGILLVEMKKDHCATYYRWEELPYRYKIRNSKAAMRWVCSKTELTEQEVRKTMRKADLKMRYALPQAVIVPIGQDQQSKQIEAVLTKDIRK